MSESIRDPEADIADAVEHWRARANPGWLRLEDALERQAESAIPPGLEEVRSAYTRLWGARMSFGASLLAPATWLAPWDSPESIPSRAREVWDARLAVLGAWGKLLAPTPR